MDSLWNQYAPQAGNSAQIASQVLAEVKRGTHGDAAAVRPLSFTAPPGFEGEIESEWTPSHRDPLIAIRPRRHANSQVHRRFVIPTYSAEDGEWMEHANS
jgi:hypothetical protein